MVRKRLIALAVMGLVFFTGRSRSETSFPRENLETRHWSYRELEELSVAGCLDSLSIYTRPIARSDAARALLDAPASARIDPRTERLRREFGQEIELMDSSVSVPHTLPVYTIDGPDGHIRFRPRLEAGMVRKFGDYWRSDPVTRLSLQGEWAFASHFLFFIEMYGQGVDGSRNYAEPLIKGTEITTLAGQVYASWSFAPFHITLGRDRMYWGIGQSGSLLLGDAAPLMSYIEYGAHWHKLHGEVFTSQLDILHNQYLSGHRIEWLPIPRLRLTFAETARYTSRQPDPLYLIGLMPYQVLQKINNAQGLPDTAVFSQNRNNLMTSVEAAWRPRAGVQLGGSLMVDETHIDDKIPARYGYQLNVLVTQVDAPHPVSVRAEFTSVGNYVYSVFYGENYEFQGSSLAYPLGPDVRNLTTRVDFDACRDLRLWLAGSYEAKGEGRLGESVPNIPTVPYNSSSLAGVVQKTLGGDVGARYFLRDNFRLEAELGVRRAKNADHLEGQNRTQLVGRLSSDIHF